MIYIYEVFFCVKGDNGSSHKRLTVDYKAEQPISAPEHLNGTENWLRDKYPDMQVDITGMLLLNQRKEENDKPVRKKGNSKN